MNSSKESKPVEEGDSWEKITSGKNESLWYTDIKEPIIRSNRLMDDVHSSVREPVDVVVVGGGIAGLTTAYLLSKSDKKVAVIEDGFIGSGETGRTTAHITHALDDRYYNLEQKHGLDGVRTAADSHTTAINCIESIVKQENIDCDFERLDGFLFLDPTDRKESLEKELEATQRAGIATTEIIGKAPLQSFDTGPCIRFPNQAQFQPLKYLKGLYHCIIRNGGQIFTETHVQEINSDSIKTTDGFKLKARNIVIATNAPIIDETSKIYDKQDAYRTYVIAARIKKGAVPTALYWDTGDQKSDNLVAPYHYIRIQKTDSIGNNNYDLLIVGGEDHQTGNFSSDDEIEKRYSQLESWTRERFPIEGIEYRWSGQVMEPQDSVAFIGHNPGENRNNIYIATGDSGNGITHGTIAGMLLTDLILGKSNPWTTLYDPSRKPRKTPGVGPEEEVQTQYKKEKTNDQSNKENDKKSPTKGEEKIAPIENIENLIKEGQGIVIEEKKIAAYKDHKGHLHTYSAVCTHLGCTVVWNNSEKSFDCPCHGSRFSTSGNVINGPANTALEHKQVQ